MPRRAHQRGAGLREKPRPASDDLKKTSSGDIGRALFDDLRAARTAAAKAENEAILRIRKDAAPAKSAIIGSTIEEARNRHERYGDPFAPWLVYRVSRQLGREVPGWVLSHLDHVAEKLTRQSPPRYLPAVPVQLGDRRGYRPLKGKELHGLVLEAFGLKLPGRAGRGDAVSRTRKRSRDDRLASEVAALRKKGSKGIAAIHEVAARYHVSPSLVERAVYPSRRKR